GEIRHTPDGTAIAPEVGYYPYSPGGEQGITYVPAWHLIDATSNAPRNESGQPIALPTVDRTVVQQTDGVAGQIVTGGNLDITAATLSNQGGIVSAARNVTLNVGTLDNSRSATLVNIVTDTVNQSELDAFLARLKALGEVDPHTGVKTLYSQLMYGTIPPSCEGDSCGAPPMTAAALNVGVNTNGAAVVAPTQTTVTHQLGKAGQITAGGSLALNGTGDLTNAGDIAAAGNIKITTPGTFTNKGVHEVNVTTVQGCVP
ncbi:hemagglutinin, partial [Cupriavidus pampae]